MTALAANPTNDKLARIIESYKLRTEAGQQAFIKHATSQIQEKIDSLTRMLLVSSRQLELLSRQRAALDVEISRWESKIEIQKQGIAGLQPFLKDAAAIGGDLKKLVLDPNASTTLRVVNFCLTLESMRL